MQIGPYTVLNHLGHGASGYVYKVNDGNADRALKASICFEEESRKRFDREIRIAQSVQHPNVIEVYDYDMTATNPYFLMELCEESIEGKCHTLNDAQKFNYALQTCFGIKALHDNSIIHRDIKPSNVLIKSNTLKVTDFSFGFFLNHNSTTLTTKDQIVGTQGYIAPEIFTEGGHKATILSDIYSLGCTLFYIFSGGIPPQYYDSKQIAPSLVGLIEKCRDNNPANRFSSVDEIIAEIQALCTPIRYLSIAELHANRNNISNAEFRNTAFDLLMRESNWSNLITGIVILGSTRRKDILMNIPDSGEKILLQLDHVSKNDNYTWKQFEDIDPFTEFCAEVFSSTNNILTKQKALELTLPFAVGNTRWNALRTIYSSMLTKLSDNDVRLLTTFLRQHRDELIKLEQEIGITLPQNVKAVF